MVVLRGLGHNVLSVTLCWCPEYLFLRLGMLCLVRVDRVLRYWNYFGMIFMGKDVKLIPSTVTCPPRS